LAGGEATQLSIPTCSSNGLCRQLARVSWRVSWGKGHKSDGLSRSCGKRMMGQLRMDVERSGHEGTGVGILRTRNTIMIVHV